MSEPILAARDLSIGYDGRVVVPEINLALEAGQVLSLAGTNGSGKSTLLKTIVGLLPPLSGSLSVFGLEPRGAAARVAYLSQFNSSDLLLPLRARDVVRMSRFTRVGLVRRLSRVDDDAVLRAMEAMEIANLAEKPLASLSGGQRQRVFLSYILAREAELVILDEPTSGLDVAGAELYKKAVARMIGRGAAVVIATHNVREAASSDRAMLLAQRVVAYGPGSAVLTPESLLAAFGVVARFENGQVVVVEKDHGCDECP
jgi:ABC-type Mn2+/Zn2+ transport system ATPase subunit